MYKDVADKQKTVNQDTFEATLLNYQINSLLKKARTGQANLAQLEFDNKQEMYRMQKVDPATIPKTATNNKHIKYMLAAAKLGFCSWFWACSCCWKSRPNESMTPTPFPIGFGPRSMLCRHCRRRRSMRKLTARQADDQIDQFIQRLDHLRFAVCGNPAELGKGRCVLITSAIGGEGKTTWPRNSLRDAARRGCPRC